MNIPALPLLERRFKAQVLNCYDVLWVDVRKLRIRCGGQMVAQRPKGVEQNCCNGEEIGALKSNVGRAISTQNVLRTGHRWCGLMAVRPCRCGAPLCQRGEAGCAGSLQQKRRHRHEYGNSPGKSDHRTNAHVQLSQPRSNPNSAVTVVLLGAVAGGSIPA